MPEDKDKKLEYLQREEIKTMQKDVAALREMEAIGEREKVSKINIEEAARKQKEKEATAQETAGQRVSEQEQAQRREEEVKRLREERIKREAETTKQEVASQEIKAEGFKDALRETQVKEEEERKRFLQRVEAKAEDKEVPLPPLPSPPPPLPEKPKKSIPLTILKKISKPGLKKPSFVQKFWVKIVLTLLAIAILAAVATFWYWYFAVREKTAAPLPAEEEIILPKPEEPVIIETPSITERILAWGYHIPASPRTIDTILIHSTYNVFNEDPYDVEGIIQEYQYYQVAAQYLISRDGIIYRLTPDEAVAYHAGISQMPDNRINVNDFSIGIELIQTKTESPNEAQYLALAQLVKYLQQEYSVPSENILGHKDVSPDRKTDPWNFDWEKFNQLIQ